MSNQIVGLVTGLVAVGIVLVVAFLLMGNLKDSDALLSNQYSGAESITIPANWTNVTLSHGNITSFVGIMNDSQTLSTGNYTVYEDVGKVQISNSTAFPTGATFNAYYYWDNYDTDAMNAVDDTLGALSPIGSTWLPLVVIFGMLGVVAVLAFGAIRIFGGR